MMYFYTDGKESQPKRAQAAAQYLPEKGHCKTFVKAKLLLSLVKSTK